MRKKIFISSRFEELKEYRDQLKEAINRFDNMEAVYLDDNRASDISILKRSLEEVKGTDLVVLLVGETYGNPVKGYNKSITHLEYDEAKQAGVPILPYFIGLSYQNGDIIEKENVVFADWQNEIRDTFKGGTCGFYPNKTDINANIQNIIADISNRINQTKLYNRSNTNDSTKLYSQYSKDVIREKEFQKAFIHLSKINAGWLHYYGQTGIGKSSFLANSSKQFKDAGLENTVYFIKSNSNTKIDNFSILNDIFNTLVRNFGSQDIVLAKKLSLIPIENSPGNKLAELKYEIKQSEFFKSLKYPFVILIDGLDQASDPESLIKDLMSGENVFSYLTTSRYPIDKLLALSIRRNIDTFEIPFMRDADMGEELFPLDKNTINAFLDKEIRNSPIFLENEKQIVTSLIADQSKGLPIYFKLVIRAVNDQLDNGISFEDLCDFIRTIPQDLSSFYHEEFRILEKSFPISMEVLKTLYLFENNVTFERLAELTRIDKNELNETIHGIRHLLIIDNNTYTLYHQSLSEALFLYFNESIDGKQGCIVNSYYIDQWTKSWPDGLKNLVLFNSKYTKFQGMKLYKETHPLYVGMRDTVIDFLSKRVNDEQALQVYYDYFFMYFFRLPSTKDKVENLEFEKLFFECKKDEFLNALMIKINALFIQSAESSIYISRRLLVMAILSQNEYIMAEMTKFFLISKNRTLFSDILELDELNVEEYHTLTSRVAQAYVIGHFIINDKCISPQLSIEHDGINLFVFSKKSDNVFQDIYDEAQRLFLEKNKPKAIIDKKLPIIYYFEGIKNLRLIMHVLATLRKDIPSDEKLLNDYHERVLGDITLRLAALKINDSKTIQVLKQSAIEKHAMMIDKISSSYEVYQNGQHTFDNEVLEYVPYFLKFDDMSMYLDSILNQNLPDIQKKSVLRAIAYTSENDKNILNKIYYTYKERFELTRADVTFLLKIVTQLKDKFLLKEMIPEVFYWDYTREERRFISYGLKFIHEPFKLSESAVKSSFLTYDTVSKWLFYRKNLTTETFEKFLTKFPDSHPKKTELIDQACVLFSPHDAVTIFDNHCKKNKNFIYRKQLIESPDDFFKLIKQEKNDTALDIANRLLRMIYLDKLDVDTRFWEWILGFCTKFKFNELHLLKKVSGMINTASFSEAMQVFIQNNPNKIPDLKFINNPDIKFQIRKLKFLVTPTDEIIAYMQNIENGEKQKEIANLLLKRELNHKDKLFVFECLDDFDKSQFELEQALKRGNPDQIKDALKSYMGAALHDSKLKNRMNYFLSTQYVPKMGLDELYTQKIWSIDHLSKAELFEWIIEYVDNIKYEDNNVIPANNKIFNHSFFNYYINDLKLKEPLDFQMNVSDLFRCYAGYRMAENEGNESMYHFYEQKMDEMIAFLSTKNEYEFLVNADKDDLFDKFDPFTFISSNESKDFDLSMISSDYMRFYERMKQLFTAYNEGTEVEKQTAESDFQKIINEIKNFPELFDALRRNSKITNPLQMKIRNIDLFEPSL